MSRLIPALISLALLAGCGWNPGAAVSAQVSTSSAAAGDTETLSGVRTRRMWAGTDGNNYISRSISPDGRYLLEADPYGDFGVRDLTTGVWHELDDNRVSAFVARAMFSPAGDRIISTRYNDEVGDYELWLQDFTIDDTGAPRGGAPRLVVPVDRGVAAYVLGGWSDDDEILTAVWRPDGTLALALLSLRTDAITVLKSLAWDEPDVTMTPDAHLIAYNYPVAENRDDADIFLIVDGTRETALVEGPSDDRVIGWLPGTTDLLFVSDRSGSPGLWRLPIVGERPAGPPTLLRDELRSLERVGFSRDELYYGVRVENPRFVAARLDEKTGGLLPLPAAFDDEKGGRVRAIEWSPGGDFLAHDLVRPGEPLRIVVRTADGQIVREWSLDLNVSRVGLRWTPDGNGIFLNGFDGRGREGLYRIDRRTGEVEVVRLFERGESNQGLRGGFAPSPDGRSLAYIYHQDERRGDPMTAVVVRDLETGREDAIHPMDVGGVLEYSPDGAWLAILESSVDWSRSQSLEIVPAGGGDARLVMDLEPRGGSYSLAGWSPDGASIYVNFSPARNGRRTELWRVATTGGGHEVVATGTSQARLHPDGTTIAYRTGETRSEVWAMDGFGGLTAALAQEVRR